MSKTNHVRLIGNIGTMPKLVQTANGGNVLSFTFATHERTKDANGNKITNTDWHNIVAFGNVANIIHTHARKGTQLMIEGMIRTRQYTDKQNNQRYVAEIIIDEFLFLGDARENPANEVVNN